MKKGLLILLTLIGFVFSTTSQAVVWWYCMRPSAITKKRIGRCPWDRHQSLYRYSGLLLPDRRWPRPIPLYGFQDVCSHSPLLLRRRKIMSINRKNGGVICTYYTTEGNIIVMYNPVEPFDFSGCYFRKNVIRCLNSV